jgi:hypothetical protein
MCNVPSHSEKKKNKKKKVQAWLLAVGGSSSCVG